MDLCRFVRREKEIAESRFEVAQGETLRHRLRVEHLERELKEVQDSLSAERERMQVNQHQMFRLSVNYSRFIEEDVILYYVCYNVFSPLR